MESFQPVVKVRAVLWDLLSDKGPKVSWYKSLDDAIAFIEGIEPGLRMEVDNGELNFWASDSDNMMATIYPEIVMQEAR